MRSAFFCILVVSAASIVICQQPFARISKNLRRAVPPHYNHDQKNIGQGLDKVARGHKIAPRQPPLRPHPGVPWQRWVHEGRWAAQADKNTELYKVRARLLEEKLKPNQFNFRPRINPQTKPKLSKKENVRVKREAGLNKVETVQRETEVKENMRHKREIMMPPIVPETIVQPLSQAKTSLKNKHPTKELNLHFYNPSIYYPEALEALANQSNPFGGRIKESEKREKRQILYFINRPPQLLARSPRTTPNPFIRETHVDEYDIIRPEVGEREGMIPSVESGSSDPGSYPLVTSQKILTDLTQKLLNLSRLITGTQREESTKYVSSNESKAREKRAPKMSKLKKKQKIEKKKRKKKKQKELSPRQLKHIRRKKEKKERRKRLHEKKLKEKRRLRHKKLGTGPYNKTITDYYGIYYDPPSSQLNDSLYDSIYDTSEIDSDAIYEERMKERYDDYPESESVDSDAYYDEQLYGDTKDSGTENEGGHKSRVGSKETVSGPDERNDYKTSTGQPHETKTSPTPTNLFAEGKGTGGSKKKE